MFMRRCIVLLSTFLCGGLCLSIANLEYARADLSIVNRHVRSIHCASNTEGKLSCFMLVLDSEDCPTGNGRGKRKVRCK